MQNAPWVMIGEVTSMKPYGGLNIFFHIKGSSVKWLSSRMCG
jgi:hypothetical protein